MKVPVSRPHLGEAEIQYVNQALQDNALSGLYGSFISRFENEFAEFSQVKYAVSCSSGTSALHLALVASGVQKGDEILVSTLTNMATFFAVLYCGATPIPVDINTETLTMDPYDLERKITNRSKGVMVVHLFGHPTDMDPINLLASKHNLLVFEDCAEAHGAEYKSKKVGGISNVGAFSFFSNKILTTGEGGMVTTDSEEIANSVRSLKALSFGTENKFMHKDIGFNYRMTNLQAAIGCGQMEAASRLVEKRREIASRYNSELKQYSEFISFPVEMPWAKSVYWMYHIVLKGHLIPLRKKIMAGLYDDGIETREGFVPFNLQDIFIQRGLTHPDDCPVARSIAYASFYLPTGPDISEIEMEFVIEKFKRNLENCI